VDTYFSEERVASIFRVEVYGIRNRVSFIGKLQGMWSLRPKSGSKELEPDPSQMQIVGRKTPLLWNNYKLSHHQNAARNRNVETDNKAYKNLTAFEYMGTFTLQYFLFCVHMAIKIKQSLI
jgi:hypothetical protein